MKGLYTVHTGHLEVEKDAPGVFFPEERDPLLAAGCFDWHETVLPEDGAQDQPHRPVIVDHEDLLRCCRLGKHNFLMMIQHKRKRCQSGMSKPPVHPPTDKEGQPAFFIVSRKSTRGARAGSALSSVETASSTVPLMDTLDIWSSRVLRSTARSFLAVSESEESLRMMSSWRDCGRMPIPPCVSRRGVLR